MDVRTLPRVAVDRSLRLLRLPLDTTIAALDRDGSKASSVGLVVDRADAAARGFAGRVLHDDRLQEDARALGIAVEERRRSLELRAQAERTRREASTEFQHDLEVADERRAVAEAKAEQQRTRVANERETDIEQVARETQQRKEASKDAARRTEQNIDQRAKKTRLAALENEAEVLDAEEHSVTATSEAQRLERAASEVKTKRKSG